MGLRPFDFLVSFWEGIGFQSSILGCNFIFLNLVRDHDSSTLKKMGLLGKC